MAPESYGPWENEAVSDLCQALSTVPSAFLGPRKQPITAVNNTAAVGSDPAAAPGIPPTATWWRCPQCRAQPGPGRSGSFSAHYAFPAELALHLRLGGSAAMGSERPEEGRREGREERGSDTSGYQPGRYLCSVSAGTACLPAPTPPLGCLTTGQAQAHELLLLKSLETDPLSPLSQRKPL